MDKALSVLVQPFNLWKFNRCHLNCTFHNPGKRRTRDRTCQRGQRCYRWRERGQPGEEVHELIEFPGIFQICKHHASLYQRPLLNWLRQRRGSYVVQSTVVKRVLLRKPYQQSHTGSDSELLQIWFRWGSINPRIPLVPPQIKHPFFCI